MRRPSTAGGRRSTTCCASLRATASVANRVKTVLDLVGLSDVTNKRAGTFSLGMGQRLGIAGALLGDPGILMFDEPVNGLDPEGIVWIRTLLRWLASEGRTVFVSSHLMTEMAMTADRLIVVGRGKLIADATVEDFVARGEQWFEVRSSRPAELASALGKAGASVEERGESSRVRGLTATEIGDIALGAGIAIYGLTEQRASLEDVFFELTGDSVEYHGILGMPARVAS